MEAGLSLPNAGPCSQALPWPQHLALAGQDGEGGAGTEPGQARDGRSFLPPRQAVPAPHPTLPCDRKAEPRFPELPPPLRPLLCRAGGVLASLLVMAAAVAMETGQ